MTALRVPAWASRIPCPCLAVDDLQALPFSQRMQAYSDYDAAISSWAVARMDRRHGGWQWRLDLRRALRSWKQYKRAVRAAQAGRRAA